MTQAVTSGAMLMCPMGLAPAPLTVVPKGQPVMFESQLAATITDCVPLVNIPSFGVCKSLANPTTASLTAAAFGALTPGPCVPVTTPWVPGAPTVLIGGVPALNASSKCTCAYGGTISITVPNTTKEQVP